MNKGKSMTDWAEREVEIVIDNLKKSIIEDDDFRYSETAYNKALELYKHIMQLWHNECSFHAVTYILKKLMNGIPLSPIKGEEGEWNCFPMWKKEIQVYQNIRLYSLFKEVSNNGEIKYTDTSRVVGIDIETSEKTLFNGLLNVIDEIFPITMPYEPKEEKFKCFVKKYKEPNGHDIGYQYLNVITPEGKNIKINKYFDIKVDSELKEVSETEFKKKYGKSTKRRKFNELKR